MSETDRRTAILLIHCPDRRGIVAAISRFLSEHGGNIVDLDQHVDTEQGVFFLRAEWELRGFALPADGIAEAFRRELAEPLDMTWRLHFSDERPRMAIFASRLAHCLYDLLARWQTGELAVDIPLIISNHDELRPVAKRFGIDFYHLPVTPETKAKVERQQNDLLADYRIDFAVLARYMQILSADFIQAWPERIINIHHSFLPAFAGARPYHAAHERGVKIIGATSHYVTEDLDAGPIIEQDVTRVTHRDSVADLVRKGRDLEQLVLARAVWLHVQRKTLVYRNRTVVFD